MAFAFYHNKKVFLLYDVYEPYKDEILGWDVIPLNGNIKTLIDYMNN